MKIAETRQLLTELVNKLFILINAAMQFFGEPAVLSSQSVAVSKVK